MNNILKSIAAVTLLLLFAQCNSGKKITPTLKVQASDPFTATITTGQEFTIDANKDNVVEARGGTLLLCPKGCFLDGDGRIVDGIVKIELTEALTLAEMLLSNLTTTADGKPLVTGGMLYFNATGNGRQLKVNKDIPVHFEMPAMDKKPGMMVYKGVRDAAGNMNWTDPKEIDKFLVNIDISLLSFLPPYFEQDVDAGMPWRNYKVATAALTDSLYYALSVMNGSELMSGLIPTQYNEPYYKKNIKVSGGKYAADDYKDGSNEVPDCCDGISRINCGIDPAIIKAIKTDKYQHTLLATREFEERLRYIFKSCNNQVLEMYINHMDKDLYELDSTVAGMLKVSNKYEDQHLADNFLQFSKQRLTKVKDADKYAVLLKGYYDTHLAEVKKELEAAKVKMTVALQQKNTVAKKLADDYCAVLATREKYRMETYGFNWTETGWINIDDGTAPKSWSAQPLEVFVTNGKDFDRTYSYVIYLAMKSLYRLNSSDNRIFYAGNDNDRSMLMPKASRAVLVGVGYKGAYPFIAVKEIITGTDNKDSLSLLPVTLDSLRYMLAQYDYAGISENSLTMELMHMERFYKESLRQKDMQKEAEFFRGLWERANPCCPLRDQAADTMQRPK